MPPSARRISTELFQPSGFFVLRAPLGPFERRLSGPCEPQGPPRSWQERRNEAHATLAHQALQPVIREALFLASPSLESTLDSWAVMPPGEASRKLDRAIFRYLARLSTRPTPFGLFASVSVGPLGASTRLRLGDTSTIQRHIRIDNRVFFALTERILRGLAATPDLPFLPNPGLYELGGKLRCAAFPPGAGQTAPRAVEVRPTRLLRRVLDAAQGGQSLAALAGHLQQAAPRTTPEAALSFLGKLVSEGILVPQWLPAATGAEPAEGFLAELSRHEALAPLQAMLGHAQQTIGQLTRQPALSPADYRNVWPAEGPPGAEKGHHGLQVDAIRPLEGALGPAPIEEMLQAARLLHLLGGETSAFADFKKKFEERYDQQAIPLCHVLDDDFGIGFGKSSFRTEPELLQGLPLPEPTKPRASWTDRDRLCLKLLQKPRAPGVLEVTLEAEDLAEWAGQEAPLPPAFGVLGTLVAASAESLDRGDFTLHSPLYCRPSSVALLSRFCHASPELARAVEAMMAAEGQNTPENELLADVVYLTDGRIANITLRPGHLPYEIVCGGRSGAPVERQIPLSDLLVRLEYGQIALYSARLGKRVRPRITNALNPAQSTTLPAYKFLHQIAVQDGMAMLAWSWGEAGSCAFLPRVRAGRTILQAATWRLSKQETDPLLRLENEALAAAVQRLRERLHLPRWVQLGDTDLLLPIDLEDPLSVEVFCHLLRGGTPAIVQEFPLAEGGRIVESREGTHTHEILVPFVSRQPAPQAASLGRPPQRNLSVRRRFAPGSEVLMAKIYSPPTLAETLLRETLVPAARQALANGAATHWFFLRFQDPAPHLRLRLFGGDRLWSEAFPLLCQALGPWLEPAFGVKLVLDTYERETERYGGEQAIEWTERIFHADSEACADLLDQLAGASPPDRGHLMMLGVDALLGDFGLDRAQRLAFVATYADRFGREMKVTGDFHHAIGARMRQSRKQLEAIVNATEAGQEEILQAGRQILAPRSRALAPLVGQLRGLEQSGQLQEPLLDILWSHIHMFINRMSDESPRQQELVIYSLLQRAYKIPAARGR